MLLSRSRSVIFLRLVLPRNLAVFATSRPLTLFAKHSKIAVGNVNNYNNYSKLSPWCFKDIVFAIEMAPRKTAKAAKATKVASSQSEDLPKNGNEDSDVEETVAGPVEVKKPRLAGRKVKAQDDELENDVEDQKTFKGGKKEVASENGNGVTKKEVEMAEDEEEEEEEKEKKPKRAARQTKGKVEEKKPATKRGRGKAVVDDVVEKEDEEEEAEQQPAPKRGKKAKAAPSKKLPKKSSKARKEDEEEKAEESDHSTEEKEEKQVEQPKKGRNAKAMKTSKTEVEEKGEESDDSAEEKEEKQVEQPKKGKNVKAVKVTSTTEVEEKGEESDDSAEEKEEKPVEQPKKGRNAKAVKVASKKKEEESGEESDDSVEKKEEKLPATKRGRKAKATSSKSSKPKEDDSEGEEQSDQSSEPEKKAPAKRGTKRGAPAKKDDGGSEKAGTSKKAKANPTVTDWDSVTVECTRENSLGKTTNFCITSWNVDGLRAWINKGGLEIIKKVNPDILCLQETKCSVEKLPEEIQNVEGYKMYWCASQKDGYAGVGILTKMMPIDVFYGIENDDQDVDGRCITAEFKKFYLINVYVPNAGRKLVTLPKRLEWNEAFKTYVKKLDEKKPVIICGDLNVAHSEIDLANPKTNKKNAGFTQEERDGMTDFLDAGFVDTFRHLYPDKEQAYTFWTYMMNARAKNTGWRLDYFLLSERSVKDMCDNVIHSQALGSDHCPITLYMNI